MPPDLDTDATLNAFLRRYLDDQENGAVSPLDVYQAQFPGHVDAIAREYRALGEAEAAGEEGGERFGAYLVVREIGRGGQGIVDLAIDTRLGRRVALKRLTRLASLSPELVERFRREAKIASRLDDPGICPVYEAGIDGGVPFIAMRHVEGTTLARCIDEARRSGRAGACAEIPSAPESATHGALPEDLTRVLRFFERLARSLHRAHENGVVHRDVKPGNVLVDREGRGVLVDFGLARIQDAAGASASVTRTGDLFGTPAYMAPEQLSSTAHVAADRRVDVYALGVTLFECLTLRRPFEAPTREGLYEAIRDHDPTDAREANPRIPSDLKTILDVALEKDPDRRYRTALALAEDLRRLAGGEPILARRPTWTQRVARWTRRHRGFVASSFVVLVLAGVALAVTTVLVAREQARTEERALAERRLLYAANVNLASYALRDGYLARMDALLAGLRPAPGDEDLRGFESRCLWTLGRAGLEHSVRAGTSPILDARLGEALWILHADGALVAVEPRDGRRLRAESLEAPAGWSPAELSGDGSRLVVASADGAVRVRRLRADAPSEIAAHHRARDGGAGVAISADGRFVACASGGELTIWDDAGGERTLPFPRKSEPTTIAVSNDGALAAAGFTDGSIRIWTAGSGDERECLGHRGRVHDLAFSPDSRRLVSASHDWRLRLWNARSGEAEAVLEGHSGLVAHTAWSPDGAFVASSGGDGTLRVWSVAERREVAPHRSAPTTSVAFAADGRLVVGEPNGVVRIWAARPDGAPLALTARTTTEHIAHHFRPIFGIAARAPILAVGDGRGGVDVWNSETRARTAIAGAARVTALAVAADGASLFLGGSDGSIEARRVAGGVAERRAAAHRGAVTTVALSPDGATLASAGDDGRVVLWNAATLEARVVAADDGRIVEGLAFAPSGALLAGSSLVWPVRLWNAHTGALVRSFDARTSPGYGLAFMDGGRRLLVATGAWSNEIVDVETGKWLRALTGHAGGTYFAVTVSPDDKTIATGSMDKTVKLWQASTGQEIATFPFETHVPFVGFAPDGRWLAAWSCDGTLKIWPAATREEVARHEAPEIR